MAIPDRMQCEYCGASVIDPAAYQRHMAEHEPGGVPNGKQMAPGPEDQTEAAAAARSSLQDPRQTPGEAERKHDEARR